MILITSIRIVNTFFVHTLWGNPDFYFYPKKHYHTVFYREIKEISISFFGGKYGFFGEISSTILGIVV